MNYQTQKRFVFLLSFIVTQSFLFSGCSLLNKIQKSLGMKKHTVRITHLGKDYKSLKKTEFDFFSTKKKVKKLTKRKPIIISYHSFKMKKLDSFLKKSNELYGQYRFANAATLRFERLMKEVYGKDFLSISEKEMRKGIKSKTTKKFNVVNKLKAAYKALKLSMKSAKDIAVKAKGLISESSGLIQDSIKRIKNNPTKAAFVPKVLVDTKNVIVRLKDVMVGTPVVVKRLATYTKVMNLLAGI
jgi:hypothetical protein